MTKFYEIAYAVGFKPWERAAAANGSRMTAMLEREAAERGGPGKALDVGCGTGAHTLTLAQQGWDVTGVDLVGRALEQARARLDEAGMSARIVKADATVLPAESVGDGFDFVLDLGCFHGLKQHERVAMARAVTARTNPDATLLMFAFTRPIGPKFMPSGATRQDVEAAYADWTVVDVVKPPTDVPGVPRIARRGEPTFFRLRRRAEA